MNRIAQLMVGLICVSASGCSVDLEVCNCLMPDGTTDIAVKQTPSHEEGCYGVSKGVRVTLSAKRVLTAWKIQKIWVDETEVLPSQMLQAITKASTLDSIKCQHLFTGTDVVDVQASQTPANTAGCSGSVDGVKVVFEAIREPDNWRKSRFWVEGEEVAGVNLQGSIRQAAMRKSVTKFGQAVGDTVTAVVKGAAEVITGK